jgi:hypothetical protein
MNNEIKQAIEKHYHLEIQTCISGPRQFVAETYVLGDTKGNQYYFERMIYYFSEISNESADSGSRIEHIKKLAKGQMAGWILPKVEETRKND